MRFETAFFDAAFDRTRHDAILTRYTLQHASRPEDFVRAVHARLRRRGTFIAIESMDGCSGCHAPDPVWAAYRAALLAVHAKIGSDGTGIARRDPYIATAIARGMRP